MKLVLVRVRVEWECFQWIWEKAPRGLYPRWQNSRWLPSSSWVRMNEWSFLCANGGNQKMSEIFFEQMVRREVWGSFFVQMVGNNLGKCESVWEEKLRWLNPRWPNSRWLPSSSWVRMNEFESDWISLSQSESGGRVFLSESERRYQGVWIQDGSVWIQNGRIQDGCHHQVEWEEMSKVFFRANGGEGDVRKFFLCKWWEPILASVSQFERKT